MTKLHFPVVLFIVLYKVVLTFYLSMEFRSVTVEIRKSFLRYVYNVISRSVTIIKPVLLCGVPRI